MESGATALEGHCTRSSFHMASAPDETKIVLYQEIGKPKARVDLFERF